MGWIGLRNMWGILVGMEMFDKIRFMMFRVDKRGRGIVEIGVIVGRRIESMGNMVGGDVGRDLRYRKMMEGILECC